MSWKPVALVPTLRTRKLWEAVALTVVCSNTSSSGKSSAPCVISHMVMRLELSILAFVEHEPFARDKRLWGVGETCSKANFSNAVLLVHVLVSNKARGFHV